MPSNENDTRNNKEPNRKVDNSGSDSLQSSIDLDDSLFPVDRYKPIKKLGQGALGAVYLCRDVHLSKIVAVKCLHMTTDETAVSFQQEARIASRLSHDNIVKTLDFGTSKSGRPFMVMEYFEGRSLEDLIEQNGKLSESAGLEIFLQLCSSLQHLHTHKIFHRDLKPSNILVNFDKADVPITKLIDFGLSKSTIQDRSGIEVQGRTIVGTPAYMSPDQVEGNTFDARSEIYSLGCVLYETFTGQPPFTGETALEILNKHIHETPIPLSETAPELASSIGHVIDKCLKKDRAERYQSIAAVIDDWNALQSGNATAFDNRLSTSEQKKRLKPLALSAVAALTIVVAGVSSYLLSPPQSSSP
ncbi:MAG: serine/threonine-protein kinase [Candidatus Melainabacteria bacterium]|nr:serine/threonine-protein kinase [Candidatus Melainabacteria bacterium]